MVLAKACEYYRSRVVGSAEGDPSGWLCLGLIGERPCAQQWGPFRVGAESYALMSVFDLLDMTKLLRRGGLVK